MATMALDRELKVFESKREELLGQYAGKYVLIKGDDIFSAYDTEADAINDGYRHFGNVPFLVKRVAAVDESANFASGWVAV